MISIIIPCYNAEKFVEASLKSILNQTCSDLEILAIDDCSTDDTVKILKSISDPRLQVHANAENLGYLKSINKLLTLATGAFIAFQDADDISHPDRLSLQLDYLLSNPTIAILGTNFSEIDSSGNVIRKHNVLANDAEIKQLLTERNPFQKPSIMFRSEVYDVIGGYREEFLSFRNISEDYDWLLRARHHFNFANINGNEPLYCYRSVNTSMTKGFGHIDQLFGHQVAQYLFRERLEHGVDSIDKGDLTNVMAFIENLRRPYIENPSRFYVEKAESLVYSGLKREAISYSWRALKIRPSFQNLRLFQHCIRKWIIGI
jgi:glycosyltransferase involved in cell wall biosynthesis